MKDIYASNTGNDRSEYAVKSLQKTNRISKAAIKTSKSVRDLSFGKPRELKLLMVEVWQQTRTLFKQPYLKNTILTCLIQFGLTSSYYTLMIWFPELFDRFEAYEKLHPGESVSVCEVSNVTMTENE